MTSRLLLPAVAAVLMLTPEGAATASTIPVTTLEDSVDSADGKCSLREAILAVNAPPGSGDCVRADVNANTITLGPGTHTLTRTGPGENASSTGDLDVLTGTVSLTLAGAGAGSTTISGGGLGDRLLDIALGAPSVTVQNLTLTGGRAPSGAAGAAGSGATGGAGDSGGAIRSLVALTLTDAVVADNRAGDGGNGGSGNNAGGGGAGGPGGAGGNGGAIDSTGGLTLTRVAFSFNAAGAGGVGGKSYPGGGLGFSGGTGGLGGTGGAIAVNGGLLVVSGSHFDGNHAGAGGAGGDGLFSVSTNPGGVGGAGGAGGRAGAVFAPGSPVFSDSTFVANVAGDGGAGGAGGGGGLEAVAGAGGTGAGGGAAGAIFLQTGNASLVNVTLVGNRAGSGGAGGRGGSGGGPDFPDGAAGGSGGLGGNGGALRRQTTGVASLNHGTVTGNLAGAGGAGGQGGSKGSSTGNAGSNGADGAAGTGGAISDASVTNDRFTEVTNSIVASNGTTSCAGNVKDGAHNIAFGDATCSGFTNADPLLGPLQGNGGPVETRALLAGSPAIDQVPADGAGCPAKDARGAARPVAGLCDIGAFEVSPPACQAVGATAAAGVPTPVTLTCTSPALAPVMFAIASQPAHGALSGLDALTGAVTYTADPAYTGTDGFGFSGTTADGTASAAVAVTVTSSPPVGGGPAAAPRLSSLKVSPKRFRAKKGTRVSFTLDQAAPVRFTLAKRLPGRRSGKRCVKPNKRNTRAKACTRTVAVRGSFTRAGEAGANAFRFTRKLPRGAYLLRATPANGNTASAPFQVVR